MRLGNIGNSKKYDFLTWHSPAILSHYIVSFCPFPFYCRSRYLWIPQRAKICSEAFMRQRQLFRPLLSWICCKQVSRWFWNFLILFWLLTAMQCHSQTVRCTPWSCSGDHEWRPRMAPTRQTATVLYYIVVMQHQARQPSSSSSSSSDSSILDALSKLCAVWSIRSAKCTVIFPKRALQGTFFCGEYPHLSPVLQ